MKTYVVLSTMYMQYEEGSHTSTIYAGDNYRKAYRMVKDRHNHMDGDSCYGYVETWENGKFIKSKEFDIY